MSVFLAIWFGFLLFMGTRIAIGAPVITHRITALWFIAGLSIAGAAIVWRSRMLARGEVAYLLEIVAEATEARPA